MEHNELTLQDMQQVELNMLLELEKVCKRHELRFYIDGGTLLGSYCYEGFIPWDDDIDIKMPRKDYEKLLQYRNEFPEYMSVIPPEEDGFSYTFTKINDERTVLIENPGASNEHKGCVYLDILPMDGHPKDEKKLRKLEKLKTLFHGAKSSFRELKHSEKLLKRLKGYIYSLIYRHKKIYKKMTRLARSCEYDSAEYVGLLIEGNRIKETFRRESLDNSVKMPFEGYEFPASSDYEQHLVTFYGEHILQSKSKHNLPYIAPSHKHIVYWRNNTCRE